MSVDITSLQVKITHESETAQRSITALANTLRNLKTTISGGAGLTTVANQIHKLNSSLAGISSPGLKIKEITDAIKPLATIEKTNLSSVVNQLKKLPQITKELEKTDIGAFANKIREVTAAIKPLADEMLKVSNGFSAFPTRIQKLITQNEKLNGSLKKSKNSWGVMGTGISQAVAKFGVATMVIRRLFYVIGGWVKLSNDYVENLNLFIVSMGEYAEEAQKYAEHVANIMGIDPSEWMRNQGVFNTLITGFGNTADKAAIMSKNLVQLGYDLSSFFNIDFEDSMQKLQSAISGELEPVRRLGYDLSQVKLQAIAAELGIKKAFSAMTQAEKSQLRYYALMTQVTTAQGDMARTLHAPANQLRILQAQLVQAGRALGNIFIPMLNAVLPYAIAFMKAIRGMAQSLANFFGFELPEIDYSGVSTVSVTEDMEDTMETAKELKRSLLGIDEINILGKQETNTDNILGDGFDFEIPQYDFLGNLIEEKSDALVNKMKEVLKTVTTIGGALLMWKLTESFITGIGKIEKLSKASKINLGITLMITGFAIAFDGFKAIGKGDAEIMDYIKAALGSALGIAGSLLLFGTTPLGWVVGITAAIAVAITGITIGSQNKINSLVKDAMFSGGDITISDMAEDVTSALDKIVKTNEPFLLMNESINTSRDNVSGLTNDIKLMIDGITKGAMTAKDELPKIKEAFDSLKTETKTILDNIYTNIVNALAGSVGDVLLSLGVSMPEVMAVINQLYGNAVQSIEKLSKEQEAIMLKIELGTATNEDYQRLIEIAKEEEEITATEAINNLNNLNKSLKNIFSGIDFESPEKITQAFASVEESAKLAKESVNNIADELISQMEILRKAATTEEQLDIANLYIKSAEINRANNLAKIDTVITGFFDDVQTGMIKNINQAQNNALEAWNGMSWIEKAFSGGSEAAYVKKALESYQNNYVIPIEKDIKESMLETKTKGETWATETMNGILEKMFDLTYWSFSFEPVVKYKKDLSDLVSNSLRGVETTTSPLANQIGSNIGDAFIKGFENSMKNIEAFQINPTTASGLAMSSTLFGSSLLSVKTPGTYASGGFPEDGLFFANSNELVGQFSNGKTAVANNEQITTGIYRAVKSAFTESGGTGGDWHIQIVNSDGQITGSTVITAVERKNRRDGKTIIPLRA